MKEPFLIRAIFGERGPREKQPKQKFADLAEDLEDELLAAFHTPAFDKRNEAAVNAVTKEAIVSARHLGQPYLSRKGPWQQERFWRDMRGALESAARASASGFMGAFKEDGTPDKEEAGKASYFAAYQEPGPAMANQVYLMEVMARLSGPYEGYDLSINRDRREKTAKQVEEALGKIGLFSLADIVASELRAFGMKDIPDVGKLRRMSEEEMYGRLSPLVADDDFFRKEYKLFDERKITYDGGSKLKPDPKQDLFARLALLCAHTTWEAAQTHRAAYDGKPDRVMKDRRDQNCRPLPDYIRFIYEKFTAEGKTPEEAVLRIAYELYKDLYILRQENREPENRFNVPGPEMYAKAAAPAKPEVRDPTVREIGGIPPTSRKPFATGRAAMATLAAVTGAALHSDSQSTFPLVNKAADKVAERYGYSRDMLTSVIASLPREGAGVEREARVGNAIGLMESFLTTIETNPAYKKAFFERFPVFEGATARERAHNAARYFGLWNPNTGYSEMIIPGDYLGFDPKTGFWLMNVSGERQQPLADAEGNRIAGPIG